MLGVLNTCKQEWLLADEYKEIFCEDIMQDDRKRVPDLDGEAYKPEIEKHQTHLS